MCVPCTTTVSSRSEDDADIDTMKEGQEPGHLSVFSKW